MYNETIKLRYWNENSVNSIEFYSFYDILREVIAREPTAEEVKELFFVLPYPIVAEGIEWGFGDTSVRESVFSFVMKNKELFLYK